MVYRYFPRWKNARSSTVVCSPAASSRCLAVGRGLMARPKIMMLDEPSLGLAPIIVTQIFEILTTINKEQSTTILVVEQNAYKALSIAHRGYMMTTGSIEAGRLEPRNYWKTKILKKCILAKKATANRAVGS